MAVTSGSRGSANTSSTAPVSETLGDNNRDSHCKKNSKGLFRSRLGPVASIQKINKDSISLSVCHVS